MAAAVLFIKGAEDCDCEAITVAAGHVQGTRALRVVQNAIAQVQARAIARTTRAPFWREPPPSAAAEEVKFCFNLYTE